MWKQFRVSLFVMFRETTNHVNNTYNETRPGFLAFVDLGRLNVIVIMFAFYTYYDKT
jgi:hypothetical protein